MLSTGEKRGAAGLSGAHSEEGRGFYVVGLDEEGILETRLVLMAAWDTGLNTFRASTEIRQNFDFTGVSTDSNVKLASFPRDGFKEWALLLAPGGDEYAGWNCLRRRGGA